MTNTFLWLPVLTGGLILTANDAYAVDIHFSGFGTVAAGFKADSYQDGRDEAPPTGEPRTEFISMALDVVL